MFNVAEQRGVLCDEEVRLCRVESRVLNKEEAQLRWGQFVREEVRRHFPNAMLRA